MRARSSSGSAAILCAATGDAEGTLARPLRPRAQRDRLSAPLRARRADAARHATRGERLVPRHGHAHDGRRARARRREPVRERLRAQLGDARGPSLDARVDGVLPTGPRLARLRSDVGQSHRDPAHRGRREPTPARRDARKPARSSAGGACSNRSRWTCKRARSAAPPMKLQPARASDDRSDFRVIARRRRVVEQMILSCRSRLESTLGREQRQAADVRRRRQPLQPRENVGELVVGQHRGRVRNHLFGRPAHVARERGPHLDSTREPRPRDAAALRGEPVTLPARAVDVELRAARGVALRGCGGGFRRLRR